MINDISKDAVRDLAHDIAKQTEESVTVTVAGQGWTFAVDATLLGQTTALIALRDAS